MSAGTLEAGTETRTTTARRSRTQDKSSQQLEESLRATEEAVVELVHGSVNVVQAFLPSAVVRPTEAVDYVFDLAEQALAVARRTAHEVASLIESGVRGVENRAA
jgi:hypothetical protein